MKRFLSVLLVFTCFPKLKTTSLLLAISLMASSQPRFSQAHGLYDQESLTVEITTDDGAAEVRYTTDGCPPTAESQLYTGPLTLTQTTVLRAVEVTDGELTSPIATSSYIFVSSVLSQP
ncbi:MAG: chitobiase/beta-hexosaminidase C-terminal domain-containing protein, partial [Prevotella sp.]|nr:chitobiase/beta-hexosaminidase C-terminal domain-containing protein [Prevotella sp.]